MIKPPRLRRGDRVAAISLSWGGAAAYPHRYQEGKRQLEQIFEVEVVETRHALRDPAWLSANPAARADDLMEAFADPTIRAIVSIIGGDDSIRLLPYLDPGIIRSNPKVVLGYSDTTVTHWACYQAGLVSFYGPSIMASFAEGRAFPYSMACLRRALFEAEPIGTVEPHRGGWTAEVVDWATAPEAMRPSRLEPQLPCRFLQGREVAEGHLLGGCLEVVEFLRGTDVWPPPASWDGAILFLETSEEAPSPQMLTRALRSYAAMGVLGRLAGVIFGRPGGDLPMERFSEYDDALLQVVREEEGLDHLPIISCMDFGHTDPMFVLPLGVRARIDPERREFAIVESGVV